MSKYQRPDLGEYVDWSVDLSKVNLAIYDHDVRHSESPSFIVYKSEMPEVAQTCLDQLIAEIGYPTITAQKTIFLMRLRKLIDTRIKRQKRINAIYEKANGLVVA